MPKIIFIHSLTNVQEMSRYSQIGENSIRIYDPGWLAS